MPAGRKRYRITIQRLKTDAEGLTRQTSGKIDYSDDSNWITHCTRWANITEPTGREWQQDDQVRSETTHIIEMEFDPDTRKITSEMRASWSDNGTTRILDFTRVLGVRQGKAGPRRDLAIEAKEHEPLV